MGQKEKADQAAAAAANAESSRRKAAAALQRHAKAKTDLKVKGRN
jgi:hypothetical protein